LDNTTAARSMEGWTTDLMAMKRIGIEFFVIRSVASGCSPAAASPWRAACPQTSAACPLGGFYRWFPRNASSSSLPTACFPDGNAPATDIDTIGTILKAAASLSLGVHLGLGYPDTSRIPPGMNTTVYFQTLVWCAFSNRILHSRMPLDPTQVRLKRTCV
jgi:hypothetical protein